MSSSLLSKTQQEQKAQEHVVGEDAVSSYDREEEYRRAQQAGSEAVMVGRETLETVVRQGEQLRNAENIADDTVYTVEKANRLLRGMTWSGWLANKFSPPVNPPEYRNQNNTDTDTIEEEKKSNSVLKPLQTYEMVPASCLAASQSVQNYHLNLQVLEDCETDEQKATCRVICDGMYRQAHVKIVDVLKGSKPSNVHPNANANESEDEDETATTSSNTTNDPNSVNNNDDDDKTKDFGLKLKEDLSYLRQRQLILHQIPSRADTNLSTTTNTTTTVDETTKLFDKTAMKNNDTTNQKSLSFTDKVTAQQEEHLNALSKQCRELGFLAGNISISAEQQAEVVDSLNSKNESLHFKMNVMNRRTEQFIKARSWGKKKAEFLYYAWIKHKASGRYLSVAPNDDSTMALSNVLDERCIFGIYKRRRTLGLQNKYNRLFVGQNMFGQLTCSASSFDRRQEWEANSGDDWSDTTLLIVSGGWGAGGYLLLQDKEGKGTQPVIGGGDFATKEQAPKWCISEFHEPC
jgi:hypothetical protein